MLDRASALKAFNGLLRGLVPETLSPGEEEWILQWSREHHVAGLFFDIRNSFKNSELRQLIEHAYQLNRQRNLIFLQEYKNLFTLFRQRSLPEPVALKGLALVSNVYSLGERQMTDMDILTTGKADYTPLFLEAGFELVPEKTWKANSHKTLFKKTFAALEITLEVHRKLFYQEPEHHAWHSQAEDNIRTLSPDDMLLHLIGHLAHQHTFLKLFWLIDIHRLLKERKSLSLQFCLAAERMKLKNSLLLTVHCLNEFFDAGIELPASEVSPMRARFLNWEFLVEPEKHRWRYLAVKHFLKDSLRENIEYDGRWLLHAACQRAGKLFSSSKTKDRP